MKTPTGRTPVRQTAMLFNFDRLGNNFDLLNDTRHAVGIFKFRAARRAMGEGVFDDFVDLIFVKLRAKMSFVTLLTAALFLMRYAAVLVGSVVFVIATRFFRLDNVRRRRLR